MGWFTMLHTRRFPKIRFLLHADSLRDTVFLLVVLWGWILLALGVGCTRTRQKGPEISTEPPGAMVFVDDRYLGLTPLSLPVLKRGAHLLRIERHGHLPVVRAIHASSARSLSFRLEAIPLGALQVVSTPAAASVWVDGVLKGITPLKVENLAVGEAEVRVERRGYEPKTFAVAIEAGQIASVDASLTPRQEEFYVNQIRQRPEDSSLALELAHLRLVRGDLDGAIVEYERALDLLLSGKDTSGQGNRIFPEIEKINRGEVEVSAGDADVLIRVRLKLLEMFERLVEKYPARADLYKRLADYYGREGQRQKAAEVFERYLERNPADLAALLNATEYYMGEGQFDKAIALCQKSIQHHPNHFLPYMRLGLAYQKKFERGDAAARQPAIAALETADRLCTERNAKLQIGRALQSLGKDKTD